MRTVNDIMSLVERYRMAGGRAEHFALKEELRSALQEELGSLNEIADVWHQGSNSFYSARLLTTLNESDILKEPV
jgi:hypothetical protein